MKKKLVRSAPETADGARLVSSPATRTLILIAAAGCVLLSIGLLAIRFVPYELLVRLARAATGSARPLAESQYSMLLPRFLPAALFYGCLGLGILMFRAVLTARFFEIFASARRLFLRYWKEAESVLSKETALHRISLLLIVSGGVLLRIAWLGEPPRYDESFTYIHFAGRSIVHVLTQYDAPNNHVLHSVFAWASCRIFGNSPPALRLPVLLTGAILLPLMYATARRFGGRIAGLFAVALAAVSGPLILYSVDARGYMLQAALLLVMLNAAMDIIAESSPGAWLLFTAAAIAGFWTVPTMLYCYLLALAWLVWMGGRRVLRPLIVSAIATGAVTVFLYMPIAIVSGPAMLLRNRWVVPLGRDEFLAETRAFPVLLYRFLHGGDSILLPILLLAGILACLLQWRTNPTAKLFLLLFPIVSIVPLAQRVVPFPRVLLPLYMVYYLAAASGLAILYRRLQARETLTALTVLTLSTACAWHLMRSGYVESHRYFPQSQAVARYLRSELQPCDRLIIGLGAGAPLEYELRRLGVHAAAFSNEETAAARVLVATARIDGTGPTRGDGLIDPSALTLAGTLSEWNLPAADFTPPRLIHSEGSAQVFELTRLGHHAGCPEPRP